ncbi:MAG: TetR/AcrR family transcriptional regulator [Verrucomicrobiota bacterium]
MSRKIEFDLNEATEAAMRLFWQQGFENTSMDQLLKEMQIGQGSFYNKFKSKRCLYQSCLKYYSEKVTAKRVEVLFKNPDIPQAINDFFRIMIKSVGSKNVPQGCLLTNSLCSEVLAEGELESYILGELEKLERVFRDKLLEARQKGQVAQSLNPATVAALLITFIQGINKVSKTHKSTNQLLKQAKCLLDSLGI